MSRLPGLTRAVLVVLAGGGIVAGASLVGGTVQLAAPHEQAGLPARSNVLVDDASLVCPGQQRIGAAGLQSVEGTVEAAVAAAPLEALPPKTSNGTGKDGADAVGTGSDGRGGAGTGSAGTGSGATGSAGTDAGGVVSLRSVGMKPSLASATSRGGQAPADVTGPAAVVARGTGPLAPGLVATQSWLHLGDDNRGLAVTPCSAPAADLWLVGGGSGASRTERIILANPGANAITVSFEIFGVKGPIAGTEGHLESIPPRSRTVVSLDSMALTEASPVVHVIATGGVVAGVLSDAWIEGATGRGIDDATPSAAPGTDLVVPGLHLGGPTFVRIANPGSHEALVQVRVLTVEGAEQPTDLRAIRVPAGSTKDVPITTSAAGAYGLHLLADRPIVAGAMEQRIATTGSDRMGDFGWAPATGPIRGVAGVLLPGLAQRRTVSYLFLASAAGGVAKVTTGQGSDITSTTVKVRPDGTAYLALGGGDRVWVTPTSGDVRAAVSVTGADAGGPFFSIAPLTSAPVSALSVPVRQVQN